MAERYNIAACLNSVRVFVDVCEAFGILAIPMPSLVMILNPKMVQLMRIKGGFPDTQEQFAAWVASGAHSAAITGEPVPGHDDGWPCHLVALVGKNMVDPSAGQFRRPVHDMDVPSTVVTTPPLSWAKGEAPHEVVTNNGTSLLYTGTWPRPT